MMFSNIVFPCKTMFENTTLQHWRCSYVQEKKWREIQSLNFAPQLNQSATIALVQQLPHAEGFGDAPGLGEAAALDVRRGAVENFRQLAK